MGENWVFKKRTFFIHPTLEVSVMNTSAREMVDVPINASPNKRIYRSIVHDYVLETALCELVDNSIDVWSVSSGGPDLKILIDIDIDQQKINVKDNAGGVRERDLRNLVSPGETNVTGLEPKEHSAVYCEISQGRMGS